MKMKKTIKGFAMLIFTMMLVFSFTATAFAFSDENTKTETQVQAANQPPASSTGTVVEKTTVTENLNPLTPDGNATLVDNATDKDDKQFLTVVTPNDNYFYIVIDHQKNADNVYMLSAIDENDLMEFVSDGKKTASGDKTNGQEDQKTSAVVKSESENVGTDTVAPTKEAASKQTSGNKMNSLYLVILVVAAATIGYYVFRMRKNKNRDDVKDEDLEFYDDETYINDDEESGEITKSSLTQPKLEDEDDQSEGI